MNDNRDHGRAVRIGDDWDWQREINERRRGLPLFGIFLILFGLFWLLGQFYDVAQIALSAFFLAVGVVLLADWVRDRSHLSLYLGTFITALSLSDILSALGIVHANGLGTLFLGVGLLIIAGIRAAGGAGWGWQVVIGVLLVIVGGSTVAGSMAGFGDRLAFPILVVLIGLLIVFRAFRPTARY